MKNRPSGLKYKIKVKNKGWFKKGTIPLNVFEKDHMPWNKDLKGIHLSSQSEYKKGENIGELNHKWKGDSVGYFGLHTWIQRKLGKAKECAVCSSTMNIHWANISHQYKRDIDDFIELCSLCHKKYDSQNQRGIASRLFNL